MKSALIFYFSGTGNTLEVLGMIQSALRGEGVKTDSCAIDSCLNGGAMPDVSAYDAVGIGYPIYAFNPPGRVEAFMRTLPCADGKPAFVFKTAGEPLPTNNASSYAIDRILRRRGYNLTYERHFLMPYNILFRFSDQVVKQIYTLSGKLSRKLAYDVMRGIQDRPRYNPFVMLAAFIMRILRPLARFNGRMYSTKDTCNLCQKCVRECGAQNIRVEGGKIRFDGKCVMCMRCVMFCPQGAVKAGWINNIAVRGPYDFKRIMGDPAIQGGMIQESRKGFYKLFKKYVSKMEGLTSGF